jgi:hypothetical protein
MAHSSKTGSSLRKPRDDRKEAWKTAPSRETTHADPEGTDAKINRTRKPLENAPRKVPGGSKPRVKRP